MKVKNVAFGFVLAIVLAVSGYVGLIGYRVFKVAQALAPLTTEVGTDTKTGQKVLASDVLAQLVIERLDAIKAQQQAKPEGK